MQFHAVRDNDPNQWIGAQFGYRSWSISSEVEVAAWLYISLRQDSSPSYYKAAPKVASHLSVFEPPSIPIAVPERYLMCQLGHSAVRPKALQGVFIEFDAETWFLRKRNLTIDQLQFIADQFPA